MSIRQEGERQELQVNEFRSRVTVNSDLVRLAATLWPTVDVQSEILIKRKSSRVHARERPSRLISFSVVTETRNASLISASSVHLETLGKKYRWLIRIEIQHRRGKREETVNF